MDLNQDVLGEACNHLHKQDRSSMSLVCKHWSQTTNNNVKYLNPYRLDMASISKRFTNLQTLDLKGTHAVRNEDFDSLSLLTSLSSLSLQGCASVTGSGLAAVAALNNLTHLSLQGCSRIKWIDLTALKPLTALHTLNIGRCRHPSIATPGNLQPLGALLPQLSSLTVGDTCHLSFVGDVVLEVIGAKGGQLTHLDLSGCSDITEAGVQALAPLQQLERLTLHNCIRIGPAALVALGQLPSLRQLDLQGCSQLQDSFLLPLAHLSALEALNLAACTRLTGSFLEGLSRLQQLRSLDVSRCSSLAAPAVLLLAALPALQQVVLSQCSHLPLSSLHHLSTATALTALTLNHFLNTRPCPEPQMEALEGWGSLHNLKALQLVGFRHPDGLPLALLRGVARMRSLTSLDLSHSLHHHVPDLAFLVGLTQLRAIQLAAWGSLPPSTLAALRSLTALTSLDLTSFSSTLLPPCPPTPLLQPRTALQHTPQQASPSSAHGSPPSSTFLPGSPSAAKIAAGCTDKDGQSDADMEGVDGDMLNNMAVAGGCPLPGGATASGLLQRSEQHGGSAVGAGCAGEGQAGGLMVEALGEMRWLEELKLEGCGWLEDGCLLGGGGRWGHLRRVLLSGCRQLGPGGLRELCGGSSGLQELGLQGCCALQLVPPQCAAPVPLPALHHLASLRRLDLRCCSRICDASLENVAQLRRLTALSLQGSPHVTSGGIAALSSLVHLRHLEMPFCWQVEDQGVVALSGLTHLHHLDVRCCWRLTPAALMPLLQQPAGQWLVLHTEGCHRICQRELEEARRKLHF